MPYISPSQIAVVPPDPGPRDDFKERALNDMMDGVLEKLWHEEIKKPIPMPQCMVSLCLLPYSLRYHFLCAMSFWKNIFCSFKLVNLGSVGVHGVVDNTFNRRRYSE